MLNLILTNDLEIEYSILTYSEEILSPHVLISLHPEISETFCLV